MLKKIFRKIFVSGYIITVIVFLIACLSPFLNPARWWFFGFLGLLFPYILTVLVIYFIALCIIRSKWVWVALVCFCVGWKGIYAVFGFNAASRFDKNKPEERIRVMTWNMRGLYPFSKKITGPILGEHLDQMFGIIQEYRPDVLALQEFGTNPNSKIFNNTARLRKMGYLYSYFPTDISNPRKKNHGTAIFSKYPILDSAYTQLPYSEEDGTEYFLEVTLKCKRDTIRIFSGHLQSFRFMRNDYSDLAKIRNDSEERVDASKNILRKMRIAFQKRGEQADFIKEKIDASKYPEVFCGDLNDVPNSYAYFAIKGDKKDAYIRKGFGFGQTYYSFTSLSMRKIPTLRIDYIFADPRFTIQQTTRVKTLLSDHIPVITDLTLTSGQ